MNDSENNQLSSWERFWRWNKKFEPWINAHTPTWSRVIWGVLFIISLVIIITPVSLIDKVLKICFSTKLFHYVFQHIVTSIVVAFAVLAMTMPQVSYSAIVANPEYFVKTSNKNPAPVYLFDTSTNMISSVKILGSDSIDSAVYVPATNIVSWFTNDGVVYVTTASGNTFPVQNLGLCGVVIVGGGLVAAGGYATYKLYKCAKRLLYPTNAPPSTNPPPNKSSGNGSASFSESSASATIVIDHFVVGLPLIFPEGITVTLDNTRENMEIANVSSEGWVDWQGNLVTSHFIMYMLPGNLISQVGYCHVQSSTNLADWVDESFLVKGWISSVGSTDTNLITVTYDQYGNPFCTNWYTLQLTNGLDYNALLTDSVRGIPKRDDPSLFFRAVIK